MQKVTNKSDPVIYHKDVVMVVHNGTSDKDNTIYRAFYGGGYFEPKNESETKQQFRVIVEGGALVRRKPLLSTSKFALQSVYAEGSSEPTKALGAAWKHWKGIGDDYGKEHGFGGAKYVGVEYNCTDALEIKHSSVWEIKR